LTALVHDPRTQRDHVFVVDGPRAVRRPVVVIARAGARANVTGLKADEVILAEPPLDLTDGAAVTVKGAVAK
jgi:hypothetical protein